MASGLGRIALTLLKPVIHLPFSILLIRKVASFKISRERYRERYIEKERERERKGERERERKREKERERERKRERERDRPDRQREKKICSGWESVTRNI